MIQYNDIEYELFVNECTKVQTYLETHLDESISDVLDKFKLKFKKAFEMAKEIADKFKMSITDILKFLKDKVIFAFFKKISFSFKKFVFVIKEGYKAYLHVLDIIAEWAHKNNVIQWTENKLKELDAYLAKHPYVKKVVGIVVAGMVIYIWYNMSFAGDIKGDFDQTALFDALSGSYSLHTIFAGKEGIKMLLLFTTGVVTGASFPWPGKSHWQFIYSLIFTYAKNKTHDIKMLSKLERIKNVIKS